MSIRARVSFSFLFTVFFIFASAENGYSGIEFAVGCCRLNDSCVGCESGCAISSPECQAGGGTSLQTNFICVDEGAGATCDSPGDNSGCCLVSQGDCLEEQIGYFTCIDDAGGTAWFQSTDCSEVPQCSQSSAADIPTLGEWGMIALAGALGLAGLIFVRRRRGLIA